MTRLRALFVMATLAAPFAARADIVADPPKKVEKAEPEKRAEPEKKPDAKEEAKAEAKEDLKEAPKPAPKPDKEGFVPVGTNEKLSEGESLPGNGLLGAAYGFILAAMVVWIASVAVRARKVEEELAELRAKIEKA